MIFGGVSINLNPPHRAGAGVSITRQQPGPNDEALNVVALYCFAKRD
jgi:hypothetical protein